MENIDKLENRSLKYLIYIDILGFESLPEEIAAKSLIGDEKIREGFVRTIDDKINEGISKGEICGKAVGHDDWVLAVDSLQLVFKVIWNISNHNSGFRGYEKIPLEIAVGIGQYNNWAEFDNNRLIYQKSTILFLKKTF
jgi:hypothetical protein